MGAGPPPRRTPSALPCISPVSPLHLPYICPTSPRRVAPLLPRRRVHRAVPPRALLGRGAARRQPARHAQCTRNMHMHRCTGTRTRRVRCMRMRMRMSCGSHAHAYVWMVVDPCDQSWPVAEMGVGWARWSRWAAGMAAGTATGTSVQRPPAPLLARLALHPDHVGPPLHPRSPSHSTHAARAVVVAPTHPTASAASSARASLATLAALAALAAALAAHLALVRRLEADRPSHPQRGPPALARRRHAPVGATTRHA